MTQIFSKALPPPVMPEPLPPVLSPTGTKSGKSTQQPSLLSLAAAQGQQQKGGGKTLLGQ